MRRTFASLSTPALIAGLVVGLMAVAPLTAGAATEPVLVVPGGERDGQVALDPPVQAPEDGWVTWLLRNGGDGALSFTLALHEVVGDDVTLDLGTRITHLGLPRDHVHLEAGEVARIRLTIPDELGIVALVARSVDAEPATELSALAVVTAGATVTPTIIGPGPGDRVATVRLHTDQPAILDLALRVSAWPGLQVSEEQLPQIIVPAGGRDLEVTLGRATFGRITIEVALFDGQDHSRASVSMWQWPRGLLALVAALLIVAAALVWARRRRLRSPDASPPEQPPGVGPSASPQPGP